MCDLEARGPGQQLNTRSPDRSNQHAISLRTRKARRPAEPEELRVNDDGTRLLQDLSAKGLLPGLVTLGTASWPSPLLSVIADQHYAVVFRDAQGVRAMFRTVGHHIRSVPRDSPLASIGTYGELFAVARDAIDDHRHRFRNQRTAPAPVHSSPKASVAFNDTARQAGSITPPSATIASTAVARGWTTLACVRFDSAE